MHACAEKPNRRGSGLEEASRGCLIHAANAIEFYREQGPSYTALHFLCKIRSPGCFVFILNDVTLQSGVCKGEFCIKQVLVTHAVKKSKLSLEGYLET